jgi:hypothetical protein
VGEAGIIPTAGGEQDATPRRVNTMMKRRRMILNIKVSFPDYYKGNAVLGLLPLSFHQDKNEDPGCLAASHRVWNSTGHVRIKIKVLQYYSLRRMV